MVAPNTLLDAIKCKWALATGHERSQVDAWVSEDPDKALHWLLLRALPSEYCFDGLSYTFQKSEDASSLSLLTTFWYLVDGQNLRAALIFLAKLNGLDINFEYSIIEESAYPSYDKLWNHLSLYAAGDPTDIYWPQATAGSF